MITCLEFSPFQVIVCFYMVGHPRFELGSLCLRGRTSPSKFIPHKFGTLDRTRTYKTRDLNAVPIPIRLQGRIGAHGGTRTHRILILSQARIPIPSQGQYWRLWKDSNPTLLPLSPLTEPASRSLGTPFCCATSTPHNLS